ncbi:unnamed protein product, partial [marine sediment metagenome]
SLLFNFTLENTFPLFLQLSKNSLGIITACEDAN